MAISWMLSGQSVPAITKPAASGGQRQVLQQVKAADLRPGSTQRFDGITAPGCEALAARHQDQGALGHSVRHPALRR